MAVLRRVFMRSNLGRLLGKTGKVVRTIIGSPNGHPHPSSPRTRTIGRYEYVENPNAVCRMMIMAPRGRSMKGRESRES
jgi:hypothetical protein